ncbi:helix-turn-helix domain-containing protein [Thermodesulfobacteriota bacterium]
METQFGTFLDSRLAELDLTQKDLAERSGLSKTYISQLKNGLRDDTSPRLSTIEKIADVLKVDPWVLQAHLNGEPVEVTFEDHFREGSDWYKALEGDFATSVKILMEHDKRKFISFAQRIIGAAEKIDAQNHRQEHKTTLMERLKDDFNAREAFPLPVTIIDLDTFRIVYANPKALELYGYPTENVSNKTLMDFIPAEDISDKLVTVQRLRQGDGYTSNQLSRHRISNGTIIDIQFAGYNFRNDRGQLLYLSIITPLPPKH